MNTSQEVLFVMSFLIISATNVTPNNIVKIISVPISLLTLILNPITIKNITKNSAVMFAFMITGNKKPAIIEVIPIGTNSPRKPVMWSPIEILLSDKINI